MSELADHRTTDASDSFSVLERQKSVAETHGIPVAVLLELTHRCPLQCPYCSNPVELDRAGTRLAEACQQPAEFTFASCQQMARFVQSPRQLPERLCLGAQRPRATHRGDRRMLTELPLQAIDFHQHRCGRERAGGAGEDNRVRRWPTPTHRHRDTFE